MGTLPHRPLCIALAAVLALAAPSAHALQKGALLIVDEGVGIWEWMPGAATSALVISGAPLVDPRAVAVDSQGRAIVASSDADTWRFSPDGRAIEPIGPPAIDIAIGPNGGIYILTASGDVRRLEVQPRLLAAGIEKPGGLAVIRGAAGQEVVLVTTEDRVLRVPPGGGAPTVLASGFTQSIGQPGIDRFGNLLVARDGQLVALDPETGATRGSFPSGGILAPEDATATGGDRYFVGIENGSGRCWLVEVDPIAGGDVPIAVPSCRKTRGVAVVPGGSPAPKLATNDLVLSDPGSFGGGGGVFRIDPNTGAARILRLGVPSALARVEVGPTREIAGTQNGLVRLDPATGAIRSLATLPAGSISGGVFMQDGSLLAILYELGVPTPLDVLLNRQILSVDRTTGAVSLLYDDQDFADLIPPGVNPCGWTPCEAGPADLAFPYRAQPGALLEGVLFVTTRSNWPMPPPASLGSVTFPITLFSGLPPVGPLGGALFNPVRAVTTSPDGAFVYYEVGNAIRRADAVGTTLVASGGLLVAPRRLAAEAAGGVVVADANAFGGGGGVIRIAAGTGVQTRLTTATFVDPTGIAVVPPPSCGDGVDNDRDLQVDFPADTGCASANDPWESVDCADGIDNDLDGTIDIGTDPSCANAQTGVEHAQCSNGADDDGDGRIDASDPNCTGPTDGSEAAASCGLGIELLPWLAAMRAVMRRGKRQHS